MKLQQIVIEDKPYMERPQFILRMDGKEILFAGGGEPEDNTIYRDLNFVFSIVGLMHQAYLAGQSGEEFETDRVDFDNYDEYEEFHHGKNN